MSYKATKVITVPKLSNFEHWQDYYGVLFHEIAHSTMVALGRELDCATEELTAELATHLLGLRFGIAPDIETRNTSYIAHWKRQGGDFAVAAEWVLKIEKHLGG